MRPARGVRGLSRAQAEALARHGGLALLPGGAVVLYGPALIAASAQATRGARTYARTDGLTLDAYASAVTAALAAGAADALTQARQPMSPRQHGDVPEPGEQAPCPQPGPEVIGTGEAARLLRVSRQQARRIVVGLGGRRGPGRAWLIERGEVEAAAAARARRDAPPDRDDP